MKAIVRDRYGSVDVLRLEEIDRPEPGDDQVLVAVRSSSLNTADLDYLHGRPVLARLGTGLSRPRNRVPGLDLAGVVEAVGSGVTSFRPGDEVWADMFDRGHGAFSEFVCASEGAFRSKPDGMTFEQAATMPHSAVLASEALRSGRPIRPGEAVLIVGAGGCVGPFAIQIAKSFGAEVTGVDHGGKLELMEAAGADHVIDFTREDVLRSGRRYDLILDIAAQRSVLGYRRSLTPTGRYVLIAATLGGFSTAFALGGLVSLGGSKRMGVFMWKPNERSHLDFLAGLFDRGELVPIIDRRVGLDEVPDALRYLEEGQSRGKIVITP